MNIFVTIFDLAFYAVFLGFFPVILLVFTLWYDYRDGKDLNPRVKEWFPIIVIPWFIALFILLAIFAIFVLFPPK